MTSADELSAPANVARERAKMFAAPRKRRLRRPHRPRLPPPNDDLAAADTVIKEILLNANGKTGCFEILGDSQHDSCSPPCVRLATTSPSEDTCVLFTCDTADHLTVTTTTTIEAATTTSPNIITIETGEDENMKDATDTGPRTHRRLQQHRRVHQVLRDSQGLEGDPVPVGEQRRFLPPAPVDPTCTLFK
ncbi:hypothetical protein EXIGLDRAFT_768494 [Exidia glandulosa HHB12029]|uniref:Uncharacterized protein n=1 Tax=Exidia glandulosa HHB12029 TaxID=1314781 RepID=A0A165I6A8_EXIGL|nr:hypothetical protein EXIGLDRAFT_768494 [Exidia glandulosa HHB12029]